MEKRKWRRFIAFILSVLMVVGIVNIPGGVVRAETDDCYEITYDGNGGWITEYIDVDTGETKHDLVQERFIEKGSNIGYEYCVPRSRSEYVFKGYQINKEGTVYVTYDSSSYELKDGEAFIDEYVPTEDTTFYAVWEEAYDVTFDPNGGWFHTYWDEDEQKDVINDSPDVFQFEIGSEIGNNYSYPFSRPGYMFTGFKKEDDNLLYVIYDRDNYELQDGEAYLREYVPTGNVTFKAQWEECYDITIDGNGGHFNWTWDNDEEKYVPGDTSWELKVRKGSSIEEGGDPFRDGYVFAGYKIDGIDTLYVTDKAEEDIEEGEENYWGYTPSGDVTFKAQWAKANKVTFNGNGGNYGMGWDSDAGDYVERESIKFDVKEGSILYNTGNDKCKRAGYLFKGYKVEGDETLYVTEDKGNYELKDGEKFLYDYKPEGDVTFYAQWAEAYEVTFHANGGDFGEEYDYDSGEYVDVESYAINFEKGSKIGYEYVWPNPRDGYKCVGYKIDDDDTLYVKADLDHEDLKTNEAYISEYEPTGNVTFYAVWEEAENLTIELDPGEGYIYDEITGDKEYGVHDLSEYFPREGGYKSGDYCSIGKLCRMPGMVFKGWKSEQNGNIYPHYYTIELEGDDTFTAQYSDGVVVELKLNGGYYTRREFPMYSQKCYGDPWYDASENGKIEFSNLMFETDEEGMTLAGWTKDGDSTLYSSQELNDMTFTDDTTFTAQWTEGYKVTFYSEEGYMKSYDPGEKTCVQYAAKNQIFSGRIPISGMNYYTRYGYYIEYWTLDDDETEYHDEDILNMVIDKDITFTAHWKKAPMITYDANGGKISDGPVQTEKFSTYCSYRATPTSMAVSREGYKLDGWKVEDDSSLSGSVITDLSTYVVRGDVTFTAQWGEDNPEDYCTVKYDPNGGWYNNSPGGSYEPLEYEYRKGSTIKLIGESSINRPYKDGATLVGWTIEGGDGTVLPPCERIDDEFVGGDFTVNEDVTFVAVWDSDYISITYITEDGDFGKDEKGYPIKESVAKVEPGKVLEYLDIPKCEGKLFMGYKIQGTDEIIYDASYLKSTGKNPEDYTTLFDYIPTKDVTLVALWDDDVYAITFESDEGIEGNPYVVVDTIYAKKGYTIPEYPWAYTEEKKEFIGYKIEGDTSGKIYKKGYVTEEEGEFFDIVPEGDMTFVAVFADGCEVTLDCDGGISKKYGSIIDTQTLVFAKDQPFPKKVWYGDELDTMYKADMILEGWTVVGDESETVYNDIADIIITEDMTIKAKWADDCSKTGHAYSELIEEVPATCTEDGMKAHYECSNCGKLFVKDGDDFVETTEEELKIAKGHNMTEHAAVQATCETAGNSAYWSCDQCNKFFSDAEGNTEIEENSWIIPAGHSYGSLIAEVPATCTVDGVKAHYECSDCGKLFVKDGDEFVEKTAADLKIASTGHSLTPHAAVEATCKAAGNSAYWSCDKCEKFFSDEEGNTEIEKDSWIIEKTDHKYGNEIAEVPATCTTDGVRAHYECSECKKLFVKDGDDFVETTEEELKIAKGHNMTEHAAVQATCETAGNSAYWSCDQCNKFFSDAEGNTEIEENSWIIPAGHSYGSLIAEVPATCTVDGVKTHYECSDCGKLFVKDGDDFVETTEAALKISAKGHKAKNVKAVAATCTSKGHKAGKKCSVCGETLEGLEEIAALGHKWDKGEVTKEPTCTKEGVRTYHCTREGCNKTKTEAIEKTEHTIVIDPAVEATTESTGLTEGSHCSVCGKTIKAQEVVPKKENPNKDDPNKKPEEPANTNYKDEWINGKWYDSNGNNTYTGILEWRSDGTGWWVQDSSNWYPADLWQKIDGVWYYFKPDGYMAANEYYNGYWFNKDGSWDPQYNLKWMSNASGWWVEDLSGWWPANSWLKIDGCWYYFDGSGYMVSNQYVDGYWIGADGVCR